MPKRILFLAVILLLMLGLLGCDQPSAKEKPAPTPDKTTAPDARPAPAPAAGEGKSVVKRIVFIDKAECCACTQRAIDASWAALQEALGQDSPLPIERVHLDTQAARAGVYRAKRALVTAPAIYFLDGADEVVELLQGDVTAAEVRAVLKKAG